MARLLEVKDLRTHFYLDEGIAKAVDGISFEVDKGETLGLVGESGCGKSVSALSIMRLIPDPPGRIVGGEISLGGKNVLDLSDEKMRDIRGNEVSMIFQEPMTSLNPVFTCGSQIEEAIILHQKVSKKEARRKAVEMLRLVGIPAPEQRVEEYPHQLSGGMRQRVMIAMSLSCHPSLLLADEPTTALDVTIQAQILELLARLQEELEMAVIMITHDLGVIAEVADRVAVMYAGKIVEYAGVKEIFGTPLHPYTQGLLKSIPKLTEAKDRLAVISGVVPNPLEFPGGCKFHPRCTLAIDACRDPEPELRRLRPDHWVRCIRAQSDGSFS
jgi:oligopeptide/dipeptide ABC transporter ATP-binding protein